MNERIDRLDKKRLRLYEQAIDKDDLTDEECYINIVEYAGNAQSHLSFRERKRRT